MGLFSFLSQDIAVDLGTANTIIINSDKMVVNEPSIVAIDRRTEKVIAIGEKARQMQGKTHDNIKTIRPLRDGVIADFNACGTDDPWDDEKWQTSIINSSLLLYGSSFVFLPVVQKLKSALYVTLLSTLAVVMST